MNVSDLIAVLQELDPTSTVVMSSDGEGNTFSPLAGYHDGYVYVPETVGSGALYELDPDETLETFQEQESEAERVVVLYPVV